MRSCSAENVVTSSTKIAAVTASAPRTTTCIHAARDVSMEKSDKTEDMSKKDTIDRIDRSYVTLSGNTLRAIQFIPSPRFTAAVSAMQALIERVPNQSPEHIAKRAVGYADALIKELSKPNKDE